MGNANSDEGRVAKSERTLPLRMVKRLWACTIRLRIEWVIACIIEGYGCTIELGNADIERLVVALGPVFQYADSHLLTQQNGGTSGTAEMDAGMNAMAK